MPSLLSSANAPSNEQLRRILPLPHLRLIQSSQDLRSRAVDAMAHVLGRL